VSLTEERVAQLVVDQALDAVVITSEAGKIIAWNHQAEVIFGWTAEEAKGLTIPETVLPPERLESYQGAVEAVQAAGGGYGERREGLGRDRDGRVFPVEVSMALVELGETRVISHFIRDISDHKTAEEALRETNELLNALLDSVPLPINVLDFEGRVKLWNRAAERTFGWTLDEVLGQFVPTCTPDDVDNLRARQDRIFAGETLTGVFVKGLKRDGTTIDADLSIAPIYGSDGRVVGSMGIITDVTEQKRAAEELREANALLQALVEATPLPISVVDLEGRTTLWNPAAEHEFGWTAEEVLGEMPPIVLPEDLEQWKRQRQRVLDGETVNDLATRRRRRDGSVLDISLSVAPVYDSDGRVSGTLGISMDITERLRAFELLRAGDEERRRLLAKLVRAQEEERQRIAGDIHDDSVQVLTALALRLEMLHRRLDDPVALEGLAEAERTARQAITRLRHLMFELRPPVLDRDGLATALRMHMEQARLDYGIEFSLDDALTAEPGQETRALVYRIAQEALVNVAKHAQAGHVHVRVGSQNGAIVVRVADNGRGFGGGEQPAGHLGLVSMRERAEMAGGWCRVESTPGKGTVVEFAVPLDGIQAAIA
jgi:PAS domain S-box-containing protein